MEELKNEIMLAINELSEQTGLNVKDLIRQAIEIYQNEKIEIEIRQYRIDKAKREKEKLFEIIENQYQEIEGLKEELLYKQKY